MLIRTLTTSVAGIAAATAITLGVPGQSDSDTPTDSTAAVSRTPSCELPDRLPDALREDFQALRDLSPDERLAELTRIRDRAADGDYGRRVRKVATRRAEHRARVVRRLPDELVGDLRALATTPADERRTAAEEIRDQALGGDYGPKVQRGAQRLVDRVAAYREACPA
ncbi:hypothetical protein BH09ACT12_BH09ACT12_07730 [soil metagenome]